MSLTRVKQPQREKTGTASNRPVRTRSRQDEGRVGKRPGAVRMPLDRQQGACGWLALGHIIKLFSADEWNCDAPCLDRKNPWPIYLSSGQSQVS
jgi:hypothetical protein